MFPVATKKNGLSISIPPDVCYIPAPVPPAGPGGIPIPFPNIGKHASATKTTKNVFAENKELLIEGSKIPSSNGDEAGCSMNGVPGNKGIVSMKNTEKVEYGKHSGKVKAEKKGVVTLTVPTKHNSTNTAGMHSVPSQTKVFAAL